MHKHFPLFRHDWLSEGGWGGGWRPSLVESILQLLTHFSQSQENVCCSVCCCSCSIEHFFQCAQSQRAQKLKVNSGVGLLQPPTPRYHPTPSTSQFPPAKNSAMPPSKQQTAPATTINNNSILREHYIHTWPHLHGEKRGDTISR